jgi:hypothetical protein
LAAPQGSPLSGEQEKHGLLFEWPRRKRSPFPCERTVPFDNDMKRFLCHPTPSTTPGRLLIRWPQRVGLGRVSHGAYCCIRFYRSPVGSEEPLAESSQASLWETGRSHPCPQAPGFSREVLDSNSQNSTYLVLQTHRRASDTPSQRVFSSVLPLKEALSRLPHLGRKFLQ